MVDLVFMLYIQCVYYVCMICKHCICGNSVYVINIGKKVDFKVDFIEINLLVDYLVAS